ncbi:HAD family hydrolase [Kocuria salsicia]|uniref:HAD family hydrolase n=1 Tax=Kocuria salsicia TaxID=664639 RepID=UPI0006D7E6E1|nr:HAD family phosphatase [Kocuria salsicia]
MEPSLPAPDPQWRPRAVVFDCDGVLMDTERAWADVQQRVAEHFGVHLDERTATDMMGLSARDVARHITREAEAAASARGERAPSLDEVLEHLLRTEEEVVSQVLEPLPGAVETVRALARQVPVAVASNSTRAILDRKIAAIGLDDVLQTWVSADDVAEGKPAPDMYEQAVRRLGVAPEQALAVEDSPAGSSAAETAGMVVLGAPHGHDEPLRSHYLVDSLADPALTQLLRGWGLEG